MKLPADMRASGMRLAFGGDDERPIELTVPTRDGKFTLLMSADACEGLARALLSAVEEIRDNGELAEKQR